MWISIYNHKGKKFHLNLDKVQMFNIGEESEMELGGETATVNEFTWDDEYGEYTHYVRRDLAERLEALVKEVVEDV